MFFRRDNSAQAVLDALDQSLAIIEFSPDGKILRANPNFCAALGYTAAELVGQHHRIFIDPVEAQSPAYQAFWEKLRRGEFDSQQYLRLGKGGRQVWIQATYNPVRGADGRVEKVVKVATDITARTKGVMALGDALAALAAGNLDQRLSEAFPHELEKIRKDFNQTVDALRSTMAKVTESTHTIANAAKEIGAASDDLSRRTEQQAASIEQTAAALEEITVTVKKTASNAKEASSSVLMAKAAAEDGGNVVGTAITAMGAIAQSSKQITDITGVIDEIAFQTNLLALNAGVEAARAGDAGRGFAVVASEVRALAQRSSEAAKQIKVLINTSSEQVRDGVKFVGQSGDALKRIVEQVVQINALVSEMAQAAGQQATGIEEVNSAVAQMDQVTQQNAAMVEESTAATRNLADETHTLTEMVGFFSLGDTVSVRTITRPAARPAAVTRLAAKPAVRPVASSGRRGGAAVAKAPAAQPSEEWSEF